AVVPGVPATLLDSHVVNRNVEFVVHHNHVCRCDVKELSQPGDWTAAGVHERKRFRENNLWSAHSEASLCDYRIRLVRLEADTDPLGERIEHHLPDVVPVARVAGPGVTEPDY
ncbi:MAG: hypothetical protein RL009_290, partial [Actinomycetota bacterium]